MRVIVASLYSLPLTVLKSSACARDADSAKIDSAVFQYFTGGGFCRFCSPHSNDKVTRNKKPAGLFIASAQFSSLPQGAHFLQASSESFICFCCSASLRSSRALAAQPSRLVPRSCGVLSGTHCRLGPAPSVSSKTTNSGHNE